MKKISSYLANLTIKITCEIHVISIDIVLVCFLVVLSSCAEFVTESHQQLIVILIQ